MITAEKANVLKVVKMEKTLIGAMIVQIVLMMLLVRIYVVVMELVIEV